MMMHQSHPQRSAPGLRDSQYLRSVGRPRRRLRIPRKGRIRIVLLVLLLLVGVRLLTRTCSRDKPAAKPLSLFSHAQVRQLLAKRPPRLDATADTVHLQNLDLRINYSLNPGLQQLGRDLLSRYHPQYAAIAALEIETGRVLTLLSYTNPKARPIGEQLYCRSVFPAASIFKTVVAATALETGRLNEGSILEHVGNRHTLYRFQLKEVVRGDPITLREAYAHSVNAVFGRIGLYMVNVQDIQIVAGRFGFGSPVPFELDVDSAVVMPCDSMLSIAELASGFNNKTRMSPLSGALMAAAIAGDGNLPRPILVDSISTLDGRPLFRNPRGAWKRAIDWETAVQLRQMMQSVVGFGTARRSFRNFKLSRFSREVECGGKTGSVSQEGMGRIDWFIGYSRPLSDYPGLALGVVTVHDEYWTVHSSYIASEMILRHLRLVGAETKPARSQALANR